MPLLTEYDGVQDTFVLSDTPIASSIDVKVNGSTVGGWTYNAGGGAVVFKEGVPSGGDSVEIVYLAAQGCEE